MTTTYADLSARPGVGAIYYFRVSVDGGTTFTLMYSTQFWGSFSGGSIAYSDPRIVNLSPLTRGLGANRGFTASSIQVELQNADGGVDWLSDRTTYETEAIESVWELYCLLYDPAQGLNDYDVKQLGTFTLVDPPVRRDASIQISLVDSVLSGLIQQAPTPTIRDWCAITDADRPFTQLEYELTGPTYGTTNVAWGTGMQHTGVFPIDTPLPLIFGYGAMEATYAYLNCYVICAVPGSASGLPTTVDAILASNNQSIPETLLNANYSPLIGPPKTMTMWTVHRTPDIVKDGKTWHLIWLNLDMTGIDYDLSPVTGQGNTFLIRQWLIANGYSLPTTTPVGATQSYAYQSANDLEGDLGLHQLIQPVRVLMRLLSHNANDLPTRGILAATVIEDLLTTCLKTSITTTGASETNTLRPSSYVAGYIDQGFAASTGVNGSAFMELTNGAMSAAIKKLCSFGQFDVFFTWSGTAKISALGATLATQTSTLATLPETLVTTVTERIPATGERNAPTNRTFLNINGKRYGPIDNAAAITAWGRPVAREIDGTWLPLLPRVDPDGLYNPNALTPNLSNFTINDTTTIRPTLTVVTSIFGTTFELCDYIYFTWRRGAIGGPYVGTVWRIENIVVDPMSSTVELTLVWCDDLRAPDNLPYILDDETLYTRVSSGGGRTATLTDGSTTVAFSSGNLVSDGVTVGDSLIVQDSTEVAALFKRNRVLRVVSITDATHLVVDLSDFGSGGPFVLTVWEIRKSAITTARATYYGKTCDGTGEFSNGAQANRILEG